MSFENLVIDGGGLLGPAYVGALAALGDLSRYKRVMGISIGSVYAMLICLAYTIDEIGVMTRGSSPKRLMSGSLLETLSVHSTGGRSNNALLYRMIGKHIAPRFGGNPDATFGDVFCKYGRMLVVVGTSIPTNTPRYFNHLSDTNMPVRLAIKISCSIPIVFKYVIYESVAYYDGAFCNYDLLEYFARTHNDRTICMTIVPRAPLFENTGIELALCALIDSSAHNRPLCPNIIRVYTNICSSDFKICPEKIDGDIYNSLFIDGYSSTKRHLATLLPAFPNTT